MTEGSIPKKGGHKGLLTCISIVVVGTIGLICVAAAGIWFFSRNMPSHNNSFLTVISTPTTGFTALSGAPIEIRSTSNYSGGVTRLDLFADGALIASQPTTLAGGSNPLVVIHSWTPRSPGRHVLMARAHAKDGTQSDSAVVFIDVSQEAASTVVEVSTLRTETGNLPTLNQIAASTGISVGELLDANPDLEGTDPDAPLGEDTTLTIPSGGGEEPGPLPSTGAPSAPENLVVNLSCTDATLTWDDTSTDEEHFVVYRIDPGTSTLHQVSGALPHNTTGYTDPIPGPGLYYYQIGARRAGEESFSMVVGATTPGMCAAPPAGGLDLVLTLGVIHTDSAFNNVSCYVDLMSAGPVVDRIPVGDFSGLPPSGPHQYRLDSGPNHGKYLLNFQDPGAPFVLVLQCMGRNPPYVDYIGHANINHPPADWADGSVRTATSTAGENGNYTVTYCLGPSTTPCAIPGAPPAPTWMTDPFLPPPTNLHMANSIDTCLDLPEGPGRVFCQVWGTMLGGYRTLFWDWNGAPHYTEADLTGYHVRLESRDRSTGTVTLRGEWDVLRRIDGTLGRVFRDAADPGVCGVDYLYYVSAVAADRRSVESHSFSFGTPDCFAPVHVSVEFSNLDVHGVNDCGDFTIFPPDTQVETSLDYFVSSGIYGSHYIYNGPFNIVSGTNAPPLAIFGGVFKPVVPISSDTQTIDINLRLTDHDNIVTCPMNPTYCNIHFELPARTQAEWHTFTHTYINNDSNSDAHCTTTIIVDGTGP